MSTHHNVYRVQYHLAVQDPDTPGPRYHTVIFVETSKNDGSGFIHHVTGDLVTGMRYEKKPGKRPEESATFYAKSLVGTMDPSQYPRALDEICQKQPPPPKQKAFNRATMRTEPVKPDGRFYKPSETRPPLI